MKQNINEVTKNEALPINEAEMIVEETKDQEAQQKAAEVEALINTIEPAAGPSFAVQIQTANILFQKLDFEGVLLGNPKPPISDTIKAYEAQTNAINNLIQENALLADIINLLDESPTLDAEQPSEPEVPVVEPVEPEEPINPAPVEPEEPEVPVEPSPEPEPEVPAKPVKLNGTRNDDILEGDSGNDKLNGKAGDDILEGHAGNDKLIGGNGDDELDGGIGIDILNAGRGDDILVGGLGADKLIGGHGDDKLYFDTDDKLVNGGKGDDIAIINEAGSANISRKVFKNIESLDADNDESNDIYLNIKDVLKLSNDNDFFIDGDEHDSLDIKNLDKAVREDDIEKDGQAYAHYSYGKTDLFIELGLEVNNVVIQEL